MNDSRPRSLMQDREIWTVLALIVLSNAVFVYAISRGLLPFGAYYLGRFFLLGLVLAGAVFLFRGWKAPFTLLAPLTVWRVNPAWFLVALIWPQAIATLVLLGKGLLSGTLLGELTATLTVAMEPSVFENVLIGAFVGEIVWIGYALAPLSQSTSILVASLIVGLFWAAWWVPMVVVGVGVIPGIPLWALFLGQTALAVMCGFVYAHTKSGWVVFALQWSANNALLIFPVAPESGDVTTFVAFGVVYMTGALLLFSRFGPFPLFSSTARAEPIRDAQ